MFDTLFYDEEHRLILNLNELKADYVSRRYHRDPFGKVFVTCPSGRYSLFAYLSRIAGMRQAREALKKFRAEKLTALDAEAYRTIQLERENKLEDLLRRSFYYYYYADSEKVASTDDFIGAFMESVYDDDRDAYAFAEGVRESVHANPDAWREEQKAFAQGLERMNRHERCDSAEAARSAVAASVVCSGTTGLSKEELQKAVYEHATGEFYLACIDIASNRYASPALLPESVDDMESFSKNTPFGFMVRTVNESAIFSTGMFITGEALKQKAYNEQKAYTDLDAAVHFATFRRRRAFTQDDYEEAQSLNHRDYEPGFGY